jgi:hypothetical protein
VGASTMGYDFGGIVFWLYEVVMGLLPNR